MHMRQLIEMKKEMHNENKIVLVLLAKRGHFSLLLHTSHFRMGDL